MTGTGPNFDRLMELLAEEATQGLSSAQEAELSRLVSENPGVERDGLALAAAAIELGLDAPRSEPIPAGLRSTLERAGRDAVARHAGTSLQFASRAGSGGIRMGMWLGWLAAAACLALAAAAWWPAISGRLQRGGGPGMAEFEAMAAEPGSMRLPWGDFALGDQPPMIAGVKGEVVWNEARQAGYLLFEGLPANDPAKEQYQLWIVDRRGLADQSGQSARISGAIFDSTGGRMVVPIKPAIPVQGAGLFAVTVEQPGGTWVSDMSRRVVAASKGS